MRTAQILFCDQGLPKNFTSQLLARVNQLEMVVLGDLFREALSNTDTLKNELTGYMDKREIIPVDTIERMILWGIQHRPRFLLIDYPRSVEQFDSFMKFCTANAISVDKLWYFTTDDVEEILNNTNHLSKLDWSKEKIEEYKKKSFADHYKFRSAMDSLLGSHKQLWHVVKLNKQELMDSELITSKISNGPL